MSNEQTTTYGCPICGKIACDGSCMGRQTTDVGDEVRPRTTRQT